MKMRDFILEILKMEEKRFTCNFVEIYDVLI